MGLAGILGFSRIFKEAGGISGAEADGKRERAALADIPLLGTARGRPLEGSGPGDGDGFAAAFVAGGEDDLDAEAGAGGMGVLPAQGGNGGVVGRFRGKDGFFAQTVVWRLKWGKSATNCPILASGGVRVRSLPPLSEVTPTPK